MSGGIETFEMCQHPGMLRRGYDAPLGSIIAIDESVQRPGVVAGVAVPACMGETIDTIWGVQSLPQSSLHLQEVLRAKIEECRVED